MSLVKRYVITFVVLFIALISLLLLNTHYGLKVHNLNVNITNASRPVQVKQEHTLTGTRDVQVGPFDIANQNEADQVNFAKHILTTRYTYNTADAYAENRNKLQKQISPRLWDRVQDHEFSAQKNRIGDSIIAEDRSTSNFISASAYVPANVLPEHNSTNQNIPIYYLVTAAYTNNKDNTANNGKQTTLIRMAVDAKQSIVNDYQVIGQENND